MNYDLPYCFVIHNTSQLFLGPKDNDEGNFGTELPKPPWCAGQFSDWLDNS